jgi:diguanylate cyclase (GGDEF)-like protein
MPESQTQPVERSAKLKLADGTRLAGDICMLPDGAMQLAGARVIRKPQSSEQTVLQAGAEAQLTIEDAATGSPDGSSPVVVNEVSGDTLVLAFTDASAAGAQQILSGLTASEESPTSVESGVAPERMAEYPAILDFLKRDSLAQLEQLMRPFLSDLANYLFDLSTQVRHSSSDQNIFYDATVAIRRNTGVLAADIVKQLGDLFTEPTPTNDGKKIGAGNGDGDLDLVDTAEFESSLAVDRMITRGEDMYHVPLEALVIRYATLQGLDPNLVRLPIHIRPLARAFQRTVTAQKYPAPVILKIFDYFTNQFINELDSYYLHLNEDLVKREIRPGLEQEITAKGTLLNKGSASRPVVRKTPPAKEQPAKKAEKDGAGPQSQEGGPTLAEMARSISGTPAGEQAPANTQQAKYDNIYKSVIDALNFRRSADDSAPAQAHNYDAAPSGGGWDGASLPAGAQTEQKLATAQDIAQALGALQQNSQVRAAVEQGNSLREYLANNKQTLGGLKDTEGLTADSLNQLDLVDNLFGTIKSQLDVTQDLKPALGDLHIPLAKLALMDPHFFLDRGHPARATLDKLAQLSTSANFPNRALEGRITEIVDQIVADYDNDSAIFDTALVKIDKLVSQQERALSRNVERVVRIQEGQEKLQKAQQAVDKVIATKVKTEHAPRVLVDLVDNGLRDLLVLTHVKEGPHSRGWKEHLKTLDQMKLWLSEQEQGDANDEMMTQRGLEAGTLIDMIEQQIASGLPTNVSHQAVLDELREITSGDRDVEFTDCTDDAVEAAAEPAQVRAKIEDLPRLRRWVMRVEQMEKGTWLTYRDKSGKKVRMQLAWVSEERDRFIFVNERGQKVADISNIQLARQLSRGVQPPAPADRLSVVDKSLYQTLEHVQKTLSFARNHDSLTKLINRVTFLDQMGRALRHAQQKHSQHAVLYLNVDQFKLVNEVYDRVHGDQVLLEFARLLSQLHSKKSSSARIESDSFAVLLLDRDMEQSMQVAEKIRRDIEASSVDIEGEKIGFTVSVGVVPIREHSPDVGQILNTARTTMHLAKEQGRNRVVQYEEDQSSASNYTQDKLQVKRDLEQAVATDRFVLQAQPIVQTRITGDAAEQLHYELLLGLANKDGTLSSPQDFILSAERYGFMTLVDRWVVKEAFSWVSHLMDAQKVIPSLSINLSGTSVTDDSFMDYLFEQISAYGVGTSRICFEITETGTISNLVKAADFVRAFRNIGCKFSIDDFGTGLASHNYLRELPVDYVKIDGSFVTNIHKNRNDYAIARSINDLAHFLGQETIAESVENDEIVAKLREIGVDYLQGWGIGRPRRLADVARDLSSIEK